MFIKHIKEEKIKNKLKKIIGKYLNLDEYKIFFFGSRVANADKVSDRADIDVGIKGEDTVDPIKLEKIREEVKDLPVLYKIDIVDFKRVDEDFQKIALKHIEPIND